MSALHAEGERRQQDAASELPPVPLKGSYKGKGSLKGSIIGFRGHWPRDSNIR